MIINFEQLDKSTLKQLEQISPAVKNYLQVISSTGIPNTIEDSLRIKRHKGFIACAAATINKSDSAENVCRFWSILADEILQSASRELGAEKLNICVFALGKLGACELNLSSDIDIAIFSKDTPGEEHFKFAKRFIHILSTITEKGFVFRVDTDLKPGGRMAPIITSLKQAQDYYWDSGATWERLALTRARPICGDQNLIAEIQYLIEKFTYRKFIDYSLLTDLQLLRKQIHYHVKVQKGDQFHLKLAPGGIRDIELFVHALLIIHGGRNKDLRTHSTEEAFNLLLKHQLFSTDDLALLKKAYWFYRQLENEVQAIGDQQTHVLEKSHSPERFDIAIDYANKINLIVEAVIGKIDHLPPLPDQYNDQILWLRSLGFDADDVESVWSSILSQTSVSQKSAEGELRRRQVLKTFVETISEKALDKNLALSILRDFLKSIRAKTAFIDLLAYEPRLLRDLSLIFGLSPYLGHLIASRPELLDSLIYRNSAAAPNEWGAFLESLAEARLLNEILAAKDFLNSQQIFPFIHQLSAVADHVAKELLNKLCHEYSVKDLNILTLGRWGSREMGFRSDLDFIFITQGSADENTHKVARRFLSRLTEQHRGGSLYSVDLRLRPSGKAGPIIMSMDSVLNYLSTEAEPWERQSYLKARLLIGSESHIRESVISRTMNSNDINELKRIRSNLITAMKDTIDVKYNPGGLLDIEFAAQICTLQQRSLPQETSTESMFSHLAQTNENWSIHIKSLSKIYWELRSLEQLRQIIALTSGSEFNPESADFSRIAKYKGLTDSSLLEHMKSLLAASDGILQKLDPRQI